VGYGHAQEKLSRPLYLLLFSEGCETIALGLLLPILAEEWALSTFEQSLLITTVYFGVAVGSYVQIYSDRYGRYSFILYNALLQTVFGIFSCLCWNYTSFLLARFFYGVGIGICLPLSASYITEISPAYMRATLLSKSRVYWSAGCVFTCLLGWVFLRSSSWRSLLFAICLPGIYSLYEHVKEGKESLRYLWVQKRKDEVCDLLNLMCRLNDKPELSVSQISLLLHSQPHEQATEELPAREMLNDKYYASTVRLLFSWFTVGFIYYGIMILLPSILQRVFEKDQRPEGFKYIFLVAISLVEVGGFFAASSIMDSPKIGRKKGVYYGMTTVFLASLLILFFGEDNILILFITLAVVKFVISATFMILYPYTAEIFETMIRGKALGICSAAGRIATMLIGVVGVYAMHWFGGNGLYFLFLLLSGAASVGAYTMPFCTGNRPIH
jgi:MFS transporter, putative metabolite:H+ symporter